MLKKILTTPMAEDLGKWSRFIVFQLKLWRQCAIQLKQNRAGQQAAALSYHTVFGIVPLAIVMVMVFQLFPAYQDVGDKVKAFIYNQVQLSDIEYSLESGESIKLTDKIDEITETFVANLNTGAITLFSGAIVLWAALGLLTTIERAFNNIWHVDRGRDFLQRVRNYWAILTLGPLLLCLGFYVSTHYLLTVNFQQGAMSFIRPAMPYLISVAALFLLYFFMPNTKVSFKSAIWGAAVAALIWTGAKYLFRIYVTKLVPYSAVYGIMGLIPLSVLWIFITWWIVLFGLQLTYATQHLKKLDEAELAAIEKGNEFFVVNDFTVIKILAYIAGQFEARHLPVSAEEICNKFNLPADFARKILEHLVGEGILFHTDEPQTGFAPATEGENITLAEIVEAVGKVSFSAAGGKGKLGELIKGHRQKLSQHTLKDMLE